MSGAKRMCSLAFIACSEQPSAQKRCPKKYDDKNGGCTKPLITPGGKPHEPDETTRVSATRASEKQGGPLNAKVLPYHCCYCRLPPPPRPPPLLLLLLPLLLLLLTRLRKRTVTGAGRRR